MSPKGSPKGSPTGSPVYHRAPVYRISNEPRFTKGAAWGRLWFSPHGPGLGRGPGLAPVYLASTQDVGALEGPLGYLSEAPKTLGGLEALGRGGRARGKASFSDCGFVLDLKVT